MAVSHWYQGQAERTNAKSFFGTHQKGTLQASAALGMELPDGRSDFPGGKQACEHQAGD